jgi:hypothetical protein
MGQTDVVCFFRLIPEAPPPRRADRAVGGTVPTRGFRYCEPLCTASAFGWYVFPPTNFSLRWDGYDVSWSLGDGEWHNLDTMQYPGFSDFFDEHCPPEVRGCAPPLLAVGAEPGIVSVWTGLLASTLPGWSLLIRAPANLAHSNRYDSYEGIIETDRWLGPLFTNIRLTKTDVAIDFRRDTPFLQVQAIPREVYEDETLSRFSVGEDIGAVTPEFWSRYRQTVVEPGTGYEREKAYYAKQVRRRGRSGAPPGSDVGCPRSVVQG